VSAVQLGQPAERPAPVLVIVVVVLVAAVVAVAVRMLVVTVVSLPIVVRVALCRGVCLPAGAVACFVPLHRRVPSPRRAS
jgi:hypothetical protein